MYDYYFSLKWRITHLIVIWVFLKLFDQKQESIFHLKFHYLNMFQLPFINQVHNIHVTKKVHFNDLEIV